MQEPQAGCYLIATPELMDPNFIGSVVLLCEHSDQGSVGLVVNRILPMRSAVLQSELDFLPGDLPIGWGGPVGSNRLHALFAGSAADGRVEVLPGMQFGGSLDDLRQCVATEQPLRLFLGYAGWESGQLESELAEGAWLLAPARRDEVLCPSEDDPWGRLAASVDARLGWMRHIPEDPTRN